MAADEAKGAKLATGYVEVVAQTGGARKQVADVFRDAEGQAQESGKIIGTHISSGIVGANSGTGQALGETLNKGLLQSAGQHQDTGQSWWAALKSGYHEGARQAGGESGQVLKTSLLDSSKDRNAGLSYWGALKAGFVDGAKQAGDESGTAIRDGLRTHLSAVKSSLSGVFEGIGIEDFREKTKTAGENLSVLGLEGGEAAEKVGGIGAAIAGIALDPIVLAAGAVLALGGAAYEATEKLYEMGEMWEQVSHGLIIQTGAAGEQLEGLNKSVENIAGKVALPIDKLGQDVGSVSQLFNVTGRDVDDLALKVARAQSSFGDFDLRSIGRDFRAFNLNPQQESQGLDAMAAAYQKTGLSFDQLSSSIANIAPVTRQFNLDFSQTAGLLTSFEQAGIDPSKVFISLTTAQKNLEKGVAGNAKKGIAAVPGITDPAELNKHLIDTLNTAKRLVDSGDIKQASEQLSGLFGKQTTRGGPDTIIQLLQRGFDPSNMTASLGVVGDKINDVYNRTTTWQSTWGEVKNSIIVALKPAAEVVHDFVSKDLEGITTWISNHKQELEQAFIGFAQGAIVAGQAVGEVFAGIIKIVSDLIALVGRVFGGISDVESFLGMDDAAAKMRSIQQSMQGVSDTGNNLANFIQNFSENTLQHLSDKLGDVDTSVHGVGNSAGQAFPKLKQAGDEAHGAGEQAGPAAEKVGTLADNLAKIKNPGPIDANVTVNALPGQGVQATGNGFNIPILLGGVTGGVIPGLSAPPPGSSVLSGPTIGTPGATGGVLGNLPSSGAQGGQTGATDPAPSTSHNTKIINGQEQFLQANGGWAPAPDPNFHGTYVLEQHQAGGPIGGMRRPGDSVPIMAKVGEHMWTDKEVDAMGGQGSMYKMRGMARAGVLQRLIKGYDTGGAIGPSELQKMLLGQGGQDRGTIPDLMSQLAKVGTKGRTPGIKFGTPIEPGNFNPSVLLDPSATTFTDNTYNGLAPDSMSFGISDIGDAVTRTRKRGWSDTKKAAQDYWRNSDPMWRFFNGLGPGDGGDVPNLRKIAGYSTGGAIFGSEGPDYYGQAFAHNSEFAVPSPTGWQTRLSPPDEKAFESWVSTHGVPFDPNATTVDYDMRGFWKDTGGAWSGGHFPDTYKTPYDTTFSGESKYAKPGTPFRWDGDNLVDTRNGQLIFAGGFQGGGAVEDGPDVAIARSLAGTPYSQGARDDCSGMVGRVVNSTLGVGGGLPTTKNMAQWLAARGFVSGTGGPGTISVGWYDHGGGPNDGHAAMTLSDGENAESGGSHGNFLVGAGAAGAGSAEFDHHMYLPNIYGQGADTGGGLTGALGGTGGGVTTAQIQSANSAVTSAQGAVNVAQQQLDEASGAPLGNGPKAQAEHDQRVASATARLDATKRDLVSANQKRDNTLSGTNGGLVSAQNAVIDATNRQADAQARLNALENDPTTKPSERTAAENALAAATEKVTVARERLTAEQNKPAKPGKGDDSVKKLLTEGGKIGGEFLKDNLPPGFQDPTGWPVVKSAGALLKWIGGISGNKDAAAILGAGGSALTGDFGGAAGSLAGLIPQPFGAVQIGSPGDSPGIPDVQAAAPGASPGLPLDPSALAGLTNPGANPPAPQGGSGDVNVDHSSTINGDVGSTQAADHVVSQQTAKQARGARTTLPAVIKNASGR